MIIIYLLMIFFVVVVVVAGTDAESMKSEAKSPSPIPEDGKFEDVVNVFSVKIVFLFVLRRT